ncbi:MAG: nuclear transport factor 2 family protein [Gemmatimonadota bacterium]
MTRSSPRAVLPILALVAAGSASCRSSLNSRPEPDFVRSNSQSEADLIRATERERVRALAEANMEVARRLHADDFQLIDPFGDSLSKEQYLGGIASGELRSPRLVCKRPQAATLSGALLTRTPSSYCAPT